MTDPKKEGEPIVFGAKADPNQEAEYKRKVDAARSKGINALKGSTPLGGMERPSIPLLTRGQGENSGVSDGLVEGGVKARPAGSPLLSPATEQQLQEAARAMNVPAGPDKEEEAASAEAEAKEQLFEAFDFDGRSEAERILNNKARRKSIESRCSEMSFEELLLQDEVKQTVTIIPEKFVVVFRTQLPCESLFVKQFMATEAQKSESYYIEKMIMCNLALGLVSINDKPIGAPVVNDDQVNEAVFLQRLKAITKKSAYVVADLSVNYAWFDLRVRRLFDPERLGNG